MTSNVIYFVDTETGGLDCNTHSIFSVAIVKWEDGNISVVYESPLIREENLCWTYKALEVNGISIEEIKNKGETPQTVARHISKYLSLSNNKQHIIGGHNVAFDVGFIKRLFRLADLDYPFSYRNVDTVSVARFLAHVGLIDTNKFSMKDLCDYFGITIEGYHTALGDALATAKLYNAMIELVDIQVGS